MITGILAILALVAFGFVVRECTKIGDSVAELQAYLNDRAQCDQMGHDRLDRLDREIVAMSTTLANMRGTIKAIRRDSWT